MNMQKRPLNHEFNATYDAIDSKQNGTAFSSRCQPFLQILAKCYTCIAFTLWTKSFASVQRCGKPKAKIIFKGILKSIKFKQISEINKESL